MNRVSLRNTLVTVWLSMAVACSDGSIGGEGGGTTNAQGTPTGGGTQSTATGKSTASGPGQGTGTSMGTGAGSSSTGGPNVTPGGPALFFTDLASGARHGNSDTSLGQAAGEDGVLVTVWGKHFGDAQGASTVTVGGVPARVYAWGPATQGADLWSRMGIQAITFQVPGSAPVGTVDVQVTVEGVVSNVLPFDVHDDGRIFFVGPNGNDGADGSFGSPWETFDAALEGMSPGDVVYLLDGFQDNSGQSDTGFIGLARSGQPGRPFAVVAYPGATATIGGDACEPTGHALVGNFSSEENGGSIYWTIGKLRIESPPDCPQDTAVSMGHGFRLVGNYLSTPRTGDGCQNGAVQCGGLGTCGGELFILGNELARAQTVNAATGSKQCHGFYISGNRQEDGVETGREIGWNYIHDCANNRAINIYNESYNGQGAPRARIEGHRIHDNWVENQRGIGLLLGNDVTGDNWFYNNVFVRTGLGPEFTDGGGFYPLQLSAGSAYDPAPTTLHVYNNLVYGESFPGGPDWAIGLVHFDGTADMVTLELKNNVLVSTESGIAYASNEAAPFGGEANLWFGAGAPPGSETAAQNGDPSFVDAAAGDFHLAPGSPARGKGVPVPFAPLDFDGVPRAEGAPSIGPFE